MTVVEFRLAVESVLIHEGRVLLTKRATDAKVAPGVWNVPAGKVKKLEVTRDAVVRETQEEIGVRVCVDRLLEERATQYSEGVFRNIFTYLTRFSDPHWAIILNNEHSAYRWVSREELDQEEFRSLLPKLKEIIRRVL